MMSRQETASSRQRAARDLAEPRMLNIEQQNKEPQNDEVVTSTFDIPCSIFCGLKELALKIVFESDCKGSIHHKGHKGYFRLKIDLSGN